MKGVASFTSSSPTPSGSLKKAEMGSAPTQPEKGAPYDPLSEF